MHSSIDTYQKFCKIDHADHNWQQIEAANHMSPLY